MSSNSENAKAGGAPAGKKVRKGPMALGRIILVLAALGAAGYGVYWWIDSVAYVGTDDAAVDGRQVKLSSKMLGRIAAEGAAEGDKVASGQVLVVLEDHDLRAQEAQATASLKYARQSLEVARVALGKAQDDFDRTSKLYSGQAATRESFDHARQALDTAGAQYSLAQASVDTAAAQLGVIEAQLLNVRIATPIDGTVEKITLNPGDLVQPGQTILSVNNLDSVWITANLEETKVGRIKAGAPALITVDAYKGRTFEGAVERIGAGIVPPAFQVGEFTKTTQRVPVKIVLSSAPEGAILLPGMSVEVKIRTGAPLPPLAEKLRL